MTLKVNIFHVEKQPRNDDECHYSYMLKIFMPETASLQLESNPLEVKVIPKNRKRRKRRARVQLKMIPGKLKSGLNQFFNIWSHDFQPPDPGGSVDTQPQLDRNSLMCLHQYARWKPPWQLECFRMAEDIILSASREATLASIFILFIYFSFILFYCVLTACLFFFCLHECLCRC